MSRMLVKLLVIAALAGLSALALAAGDRLLDHSYRPLAGKTPVNLDTAYRGQVLVIVNTASKCGFTPQFEALEGLHARYKARGFAVLGFPSGDFMAQEFTDEKKIQEFCTLTYGVKFPMFQKVHVKGDEATPFYKALAKATGEAPKWNFHKYVIGRDGKVVASFGSRTKPDAPEVIAAIEAALRQPVPKSAEP
jgi:glutathione peroxidase